VPPQEGSYSLIAEELAGPKPHIWEIGRQALERTHLQRGGKKGDLRDGDSSISLSNSGGASDHICPGRNVEQKSAELQNPDAGLVGSGRQGPPQLFASALKYSSFGAPRC